MYWVCLLTYKYSLHTARIVNFDARLWTLVWSIPEVQTACYVTCNQLQGVSLWIRMVEGR